MNLHMKILKRLLSALQCSQERCWNTMLQTIDVLQLKLVDRL